jgi:hypothetical protein
MPLSPSNQLAKQRHQILPALGGVIFLTRRMILVTAPFDEPAALEPFEAVREDIARDSFGRRQHVRESPLFIEEKIAHHQKSPAVADNI